MSNIRKFLFCLIHIKYAEMCCKRISRSADFPIVYSENLSEILDGIDMERIDPNSAPAPLTCPMVEAANPQLPF